MVFAKETSDGLTSLVKKLDKATAANKSCSAGSFVVFLSDDKDLEAKLKKLAEKEHLENTVLTIDNPAGPKDMKIAKDADVTVVVYLKKEAKANFAFRKGELTPAKIDKIIDEFGKVAAEKAGEKKK
jgi:hypothetical protein